MTKETPQTYAITGFFKESNFQNPEVRFERGIDPNNAVANLIERAGGDFKLIGVVAKSDMVDLLTKLEAWEDSENVSAR